MRVRFPVACLCVLLITGAVAAGLLRILDSSRPKAATNADVPWLPPASAVRVMSLGYHALAADLFWFRTVQYFGERIQSDTRFPYLYRLVDLATSLDPHFLDAYQLGGLFLSIGRAFPEAIAIYRKGIEHNPDRWELPYELGRMYFLDLGDIPAALEWFERANTLSGRPPYVPRMVAILRARVGLIEAALEMWEQIHKTTDNTWIRERAAQEIGKLRARQTPGGRGRNAGRPVP
jgi:tetratricopeptide (TPR) repeat protein